MKRVWSRNDFQFNTHMRRVLSDLGLDKSDYLWLISDIDAYPSKLEYEKLITGKQYVILSTRKLVDMLENDDFQWVWAVFSAIPSHCKEEDILNLNFDLPHIESFTEEQYNPYEDEPKLQHPYAELEILCSESGFALISNNDDLINRFRKCYPRYTDYFTICFHSLKAYIEEYKEVADKIYVCNFLNCDKKKMEHSKITLVKNIFRRYIVTDWLDYEYGSYVARKEFSDKNEAAEFAWKLFVKEMTAINNAN